MLMTAAIGPCSTLCVDSAVVTALCHGRPRHSAVMRAADHRAASDTTKISTTSTAANIELVNYGDQEHFRPHQGLWTPNPDQVLQLLEWALAHRDKLRLGSDGRSQQLRNARARPGRHGTDR